MSHNYYWITNTSTFPSTPLCTGVQVYPYSLHPSTSSCLGNLEWMVQVLPLLLQRSWVHSSIPSYRCPQSYLLKIQPPLFFTWFFILFTISPISGMTFFLVLKYYFQTPSQQTIPQILLFFLLSGVPVQINAHVKPNKCPSMTPKIVIFGFWQMFFPAAPQLWSEPVTEVWTSQPCLRYGGEVAKGIKLLSFFLSRWNVSQFMSAVSRGVISENFHVPSTNLSLCLLL